MGILFVLIFYFIALAVAATVSATILVAGTRWYLRGVSPKRSRALKLAGAFPFACVLFAGLWFIGYWGINETVFDHDPMIGDGWHTQLGNGYAIDMIDVTDQGFVHPVGEMNGSGQIGGVRRLQLAGDQMFGAQDTKTFQEFGFDRQQEDVFFALNTKNGDKHEFRSEGELRLYARQVGMMLELKPIEKVYWEHRSMTFEWFAFAVLFCVPLIALVRLVSYVRSIRRDRDAGEGLSLDPVA